MKLKFQTEIFVLQAALRRRMTSKKPILVINKHGNDFSGYWLNGPREQVRGHSQQDVEQKLLIIIDKWAHLITSHDTSEEIKEE